jgi:nucleotide-binding universal stress UspA family protein
MRIASWPASTSPTTRITWRMPRPGRRGARGPPGTAAYHRSPGDADLRRGPQRGDRFRRAGEAPHKLSAEDEQRSARRASGAAFLTRLRERAAAIGVAEVDIRQRYGELEETLLEQEERVRLIVLGRRGRSAETTQRDLGRNVERVVRALHRPILTVTEGFSEPERVMFAFDGGAVTRRGVDMVAASPLFRDLPILLFMSGRAGSDARRKLSAAEAQLQEAGLEVEAELVPGDAETVIAGKVRERDIDLLIMGAFGHSPLRSLLFGSKTADLLRSATIPTLLLR